MGLISEWFVISIVLYAMGVGLVILADVYLVYQIRRYMVYPSLRQPHHKKRLWWCAVGLLLVNVGLVVDWWRYEQAIQAEQARVAASSMTLQQPLWLAGLNMPSGTVLQASVSDDARLMEPHDFYRANFPSDVRWQGVPIRQFERELEDGQWGQQVTVIPSEDVTVMGWQCANHQPISWRRRVFNQPVPLITEDATAYFVFERCTLVTPQTLFLPEWLAGSITYHTVEQITDHQHVQAQTRWHVVADKIALNNLPISWLKLELDAQQHIQALKMVFLTETAGCPAHEYIMWQAKQPDVLYIHHREDQPVSTSSCLGKTLIMQTPHSSH